MTWTNLEVENQCMTANDCMKTDPPLSQLYPELKENCPKLTAIEHMLKEPKHKGAPAIIMPSFPRLTLVAERVCPFLARILEFIRVEAGSLS